MSPGVDDVKTRLLSAHLPEDAVTVPGVGTVRVRGLSRAEVLAFDNTLDAAGRERRLVAMAIVEPQLSEDEVAIWQSTSVTGEIETVANKIMVLSGLAKDAAKQAYKDFEADPGSEFRVLPGGEAGDDGGSPAGGNAE